MFCSTFQERRDLIPGHATSLGPISSIGTPSVVNTAVTSPGYSSSGPPAPRLTHTPTTVDFQPPYFPPPYNLPPQQQFELHHPHVSGTVTDPYTAAAAAAHLNIQHPAAAAAAAAAAQHQYHQLHTTQQTGQRNAIGLGGNGRRDDEHPGGVIHMQSPPNLPPGMGGYDGRRSVADYATGLRRPDVLMHGGTHIGSDQDLITIQHSGLPSMDDGQVGFRLVSSTFSEILLFKY